MPAGKCDSIWALGWTSETPIETSAHSRPLMLAGFHMIAPDESIGQAVAAPAIDELTGPTALNASPCENPLRPQSNMHVRAPARTVSFQFIMSGTHD